MRVEINNETIDANVLEKNEDYALISIGSRAYKIFKKDVSQKISPFNQHLQIFDGDIEAYCKVLPKAKSATTKDLGEGSLLSPMPGKILKVYKNKGDTITKGEVILIMEAMKMEHAIKAGSDCTLKEIFYKEGDQVDGQSLLCEVE